MRDGIIQHEVAASTSKSTSSSKNNRNEPARRKLNASGVAGRDSEANDLAVEELAARSPGTVDSLVAVDTTQNNNNNSNAEVSSSSSSSSHTNESRRRNLTNSYLLSSENKRNNNNNNTTTTTTTTTAGSSINQYNRNIDSDIDTTHEDDNKQLIEASAYTSHPTKPKAYNYPPILPPKYDFQNLGTALPLVLMPAATTTIAAPAPANPIPPPGGSYYTLNDANSWQANFAGETISAAVPNSDYFISNSTPTVSDDYFFPIVCGMRDTPASAASALANRWSDNYGDMSNLGVGYSTSSPYYAGALAPFQQFQQSQQQTPQPAQQQWVVPYNSGNYYTSLQPQNFYANLAAPGVPPGIPPQFICKRDCMPTTRYPTTRCTRRPGSPQPIIAWENNNTCCCELCGIACKGQFNRGKGPQYGPCKPAPQPMPNNRNALYCHGRRRKREYYLSAPKARQRLQRESDRCRITTTTTPKPRAWPTNYPIKFRLQKSVENIGPHNPHIQNIDTGIPVANQVSNVPMSPAASHQLDKILIFENQHQHQQHQQQQQQQQQRQSTGTSNKIQVVHENKSARPAKTHCRSKNVAETASSKLRKKHNEIRMQELQESLEIALEKMNQEMND